MLAQRHPELDIVYSVHLNPRVQEPVKRVLGKLPNVRLVAPQSYEPFVALMCGATFILTEIRLSVRKDSMAESGSSERTKRRSYPRPSG